MANTRIGLVNVLEAGTVKNGSGGAPPLDETSPYLMSKALNPDRSIPWMVGVPPGASPIDFDMDLGADKDMTAFGVLGYTPASGSPISTVEVFTGSGVYPPGAWTSRGSFSLSANPRDNGLTLAQVTQRCVRYRFTHGGGVAWSIGRLWAGAPTDLTGIHSPGGEKNPFRNRAEETMPSGVTYLSELGYPGGEMTLPWNSIPQSLRDTLLTLHGQVGTLVVIDADGVWQEMFVPNGKVSVARTSQLFNANVELRRQP